MLSWLFKQRPEQAAARQLYAAAVEQARRPEFYVAAKVEDSLDGRFEMVALHVFLLLHRLKGDSSDAAPVLSQHLVDSLFADMDRAFRELGAADIGVGRRVKRTAEAFYGRAAAYEAGLRDAEPSLEQALIRNVYGAADSVPDAPQIGRLAAYVRAAAAQLAAQGTAALATGRVEFPALPQH